MIHYNARINHMLYKVFAHPRYFLGGHRPSETSILTSSNIKYLHMLYSRQKILVVKVNGLTLLRRNKTLR